MYTDSQINDFYSKIEQYDHNHKLLNTFENITVASKETGVERTTISHCISGRRKTGKGYVWKKVRDWDKLIELMNGKEL